MWVISPSRGFISAVAYRDEPDVIIVRARAQEHLEACLAVIPGFDPADAPVECDDDADYRWRAYLGRGEYVRMVAALAEETTYENVKGAARDAGNTQLEYAMHRVWWDLLDLDDRPGGKWGASSWDDVDEWTTEDDVEVDSVTPGRMDALRAVADGSPGFIGRRGEKKRKGWRR